MKIAFVANTSWNIYNFRKGLVHFFLSRKDEVIVLAPFDEYTSSLESWGCKVFDTSLDGTGSNPLKDIKYFNKLIILFKREKPDVVLSFTIKPNIYSSLSGRLTSIPVICNVSGLGTVFLVQGLTGKLAISLYKLAFRYSSAVFFQNPDDRDLFTSVIHVANEKVYEVPGSGIDLKEFNALPLPSNDRTKFLMISRVIVEKGVKEYAEAASFFEHDDNVSFTLVGKYDASHARSISQDQLNLWQKKGWLTYLSHSNEIMKLVREHDVIVLPSYREGTPRTLLEGAAMGRPLIATNAPGCKEVVRDGFNGFLCGVRNARNLADKMRLFLSLSNSEKQKLASNSRIVAEEKFDEQIVIDTYVEAIHRINGIA